jgi:hypothetical protein
MIVIGRVKIVAELIRIVKGRQMRNSAPADLVDKFFNYKRIQIKYRKCKAKFVRKMLSKLAKVGLEKSWNPDWQPILYTDL